MKYKLYKIERVRTTTGKDKADIVLDNDVKATIWGDFPNFSTLEEGQDVEGDLIPAKDSKYSPTLSPVRATTGGFKPSGGMNKMIKEKQEGIEKSQDRKEDSIKTSSSMRDAVQITLAELGNLKDHTEYESRVLYWRKWLLDNWDLPF